jgi:DNA-binding GntR family transcriptional regulator
LNMLPWITSDTSARLQTMRDTSLAKLVREDLLERILRGDLAPGDRINEPDVCARLQVSRVPVREALRELESSGLVASRKHSGTFVREIQDTEVLDLYEMRSLLDGFAGGKVAALPDEQRQILATALTASVSAMQAAATQQDVAAYYAENLQFHWLIIEAAGNQPLASTYRDVVQKLHLARLKSLSQGLSMQSSVAEHTRIAQAIAQGQTEEARQLLTHHVSSAFARLQQSHATRTPGTKNSQGDYS